MYFRRLRTLVNDVLAPGRMEALYDAPLGPAQSVATLDYSAWPYPGSPVSYTTFRKRLFNDITAAAPLRQRSSGPRQPAGRPGHPDRRDPALPHRRRHGRVRRALQPGHPGHRPLRMDDRRRRRTHDPARHRDPAALRDDLGRPTTRRSAPPTAPPSSSATASPAPSPATGTLTLTRPDGTTADAITYGGEGWPVPTNGQSLELLDPASDNNDGANWALSTGAGTPGTPRSTGPVVTAPGGTHDRHRHRWQHHGHRRLDRTHRQRRLRHHRLPGPRRRHRRHPGRRPATRRRRRPPASPSPGSPTAPPTASRSPPPTPPAPAPTPPCPTPSPPPPAPSSPPPRPPRSAPPPPATPPPPSAGPHPPTTAAPPSPATRSASSTPPAPRSAPCDPPAPRATSLTVTGLTNGTTYRLQVAATNTAGTGPTPPCPTPSPPTPAPPAARAPIIGTPTQGAAGGSLTAIARWTRPPAPAAQPSWTTGSPHCG